MAPCRGAPNINSRTLLYKYSPGYSTWAKEFYNLDEYGELTERQKRIMATPSIHEHPEIV